MKKSIQQNPDVQSPNNISYVPIKKKPKMMYHPQHNSILKQPSVIEQISGKGPSQLLLRYKIESLNLSICQSQFTLYTSM